MYINNLIYKLAAEFRRDFVLDDDRANELIAIISKYQIPIQNYKLDKLADQQILLTVEEVLSNLINAAQKDIKYLSYNQPEFSNYKHFPTIKRLGQYICDLAYIEICSNLIVRNIENFDKFQKDIDKTIQSGLKEIQHSYNVMEQSVENFILPKLENFSNAHDELSKKEIYSLAVFADSLNKTILQAENKKNEGSFARIYHYQNFDKKLLDDLKNSALIAYNLVKDEDKQRCKTAQEIERTR